MNKMTSTTPVRANKVETATANPDPILIWLNSINLTTENGATSTRKARDRFRVKARTTSKKGSQRGNLG